MARNLQLLLTENVDNLGIVGDVVNVRTGFARNYLLPRQMATKPSEEAIKALAGKRAEAERMIAEERAKRAEIAKKLENFELSLVRSCNDLGILYGAVTQHEISSALHEKGYEVRPRDVRLPHAIKRVDNYDVHIKFEADLEATIKLHVLPDRELELEDEKPEPVVDREGHAAQAGAKGGEEKPRKGRKGEEKDAEAAPAAEKESAPADAKGKKAKKSEKAKKE